MLPLRSHRSSGAPARRPGVLLACLVLALTAALAPTGRADAATNPFTIDGQVPDAGAEELSDTSGAVKELGPKNGSSTKIGVIHDADPPMLAMTNPNAQVDLRRAWLDLERDATNHDWVYFAWERDSNSGSGFVAFEFMEEPLPSACQGYEASDADLIADCNPWANRKAGDFLILWDQQGGSTDLYKRVWGAGPGGLVLGDAEPLVNAVAQFSADGFRGEAAVDITASGLADPDRCVSFANVIPSTVTGNSDTADYKDTVFDTVTPVSNCTASILTTPKKGDGTALPMGGLDIGTGVVPVTDEATISLTGGTATPTGAISFHLCKIDVGTCTAGGTAVGSTDISGGNYPRTVLSPVAYVTAAGRYCWRAEWPGDAANNIPATTDSAASECFTVAPVTPTLTTSAGPDTVAGGSVTDTATLAGTATQPADPVINLDGTAGPAAGGTITFKLYGPSAEACGDLVHTSAGVPVSGDDDYATPDPQFAPSAVGEYHWVATYSGSPNTNGLTHNAACTEEAEDVSVLDVASTIATTQTWVPNDSASVSAPAGGNLDGTVTFTLHPSADCTGTPVHTETEDVSGASPQVVSTSNTTAVSASGSYSWRVVYDSDNPAQRDIPASCQETSVLTITNGNPVSSP